MDARDVRLDVALYGVGGTVVDLASTRFFARVGDVVIRAAYETLGYFEVPTPHGPLATPVARLRFESPLPERATIAVVFDHPQRGPIEVHRFATGSARLPGVASAAIATVVDPASDHGPPTPPLPGAPAGVPLRSFAFSLGEGPWIVRVEGSRSRVELALGPCVFTGSVALRAGESCVVRALDGADARMPERARIDLRA